MVQRRSGTVQESVIGSSVRAAGTHIRCNTNASG